MPDTRMEQIAQFIHSSQPAMLDLLKRLVNIESPSDHPDGVNEVGNIVYQELELLGFKVQRLTEQHHGSHLLADREKPGAKKVLFMGHMDTVYPVGTGWPFRVEGDKVFGPGVLDMKSGIVSILFALKALEETGEVPFACRIFLNSDEEPGSPRSRQLLPDYATGMDCAFVLEPAESGGELIVQRKGVGIFTLTVEGRSAHAGQEPEKGINANLELAHQIIATASFANTDVGTTINAGLIKGGAAPYVVSDRAEARIDVRVWNAEEQQRIERSMADLTRATKVEGSKIIISGGFHRPPMILLPGSSKLMDKVTVGGKRCGQDVIFGKSGAASDANNLVAMGIPTIDGMGPVGGRAHSRDEFMDLSTFFDKTILLASSLLLLTQDE